MNSNTLAHDDHRRQLEVAVRPFRASEGLKHSGELDSEEEVIVLEEPERPEVCEPKVIRAPRDPTQKEI